MKKFFKKLSRFIPTKRKIIQLYTALLFNANFKGFVTGKIYQGSTKKMCIPGLNCYSCPGADGACPLGSLQGSFSADKSTLFYVGGILLLYAFLFGRMICGWFCPFGLIQELLHKIKTPKIKKGVVTKALSYLKYVILVFFVIIVPIIYACRDVPLPAFCKYICPAGTLGGGVSLLANEANESFFSMLGPLFTWKFVLMISILVLCIFIFRMFCRFICPLGALYSLFNRISIFGIKIDKPKCTDCNLCVNKCKMDIRRPGDIECISCGECIDVCPTKAISWKGPKIFLKDNELANMADESVKKKKANARLVTRIISCIVLCAVLIGAIVYYWNDNNALDSATSDTATSDTATSDTAKPDSATPDSAAPVLGNGIGNLCYGSDLTIATGDGFLNETINPVKTGKITVINFWGTWCGPCVNELPYFDRIASEYADDVTVIAIHSDMLNETAPAFIKQHYPNSDIVFAKDLSGAAYYTMLGGRGAYPFTIVLDEDGIVCESIVKALHYEDLKAIVDGLLE